MSHSWRVDTVEEDTPRRRGLLSKTVSIMLQKRFSETSRDSSPGDEGSRNMEELGSVLEEEALELHLIAMSSRPPIFYWTAGTIAVLRRVRALRVEGFAAYSTIDAGPNVHVICPSEQEGEVAAELRRMPETESVIADRVGTGPYLTDEHLV